MGNGQSAWVMIVRNHMGSLLLFATRWGEDQDPPVAECKALVWAANIAVSKGW